MGAACCAAAKDRTVVCGSPVTAVQRHSHYSPSWTFRWDNHGRVVGEETAVEWLHNEGRDGDRMEVKSGTTVQATFASDEGSPMDSFRSLSWLKSPDEGNGKILMSPSSDPVASRYHGKARESFGSPSASCQSPPLPCVSSMSDSPMSSQSHFLPANVTPSRGHHRSGARPFLRQVSDSGILEYRSPTFSISEKPPSFLPLVWGNETTRVSDGGSSDSWSIPAFSEHLTSTPRERCSFGSEASSFSHEKTYRNKGQKRGSSLDLQTCGICSKPVTERSSWSWTTQKLIAFNEIAVVSVLTCGHVFHGECLEYMTPDINKYDPPCPFCAYGPKKIGRMCENALRAELESMAKRRSKKSVAVSTSRSVDTLKTSEVDSRRASKISSGSGSQSSTGKPFLRRDFSFGSGSGMSMSRNQSTPRKSFFWARSSKY